MTLSIADEVMSSAPVPYPESELPSNPTPSLDEAIERARAALIAKQAPGGWWVGELQGDSILESEYLLLKWILGHETDPELPKVANYLRQIQTADGSWVQYPGAPPDLSATVKGYFALKLMGDDASSPHMTRAKEMVHKLGGAEKCNTFTRFFLASLGQISFDSCPSIPPEVVFLPQWFYFNLYNVSAWTRVMILPLGIVTTLRKSRQIPDLLGIRDLYLDYEAGNSLGKPKSGFPRNWADFFLRADQLLKKYEESPFHLLRERALKAAEKWLLAHIESSEGLGAIFPSMAYMLVVLRLLGYSDDHPVVVKCHKELKDFFIEEGDTIRLQPCVSPVWDSGIALHALAETGISPDEPAVRMGTEWLLNMEVRVASDWQRKTRKVEPSGWFFEFSNPHYPDTDDTAMAIMSLKRLGGSKATEAIRRGVAWLLAFQNSDGGWAAFDKTESRPILEFIPFADHNAMQDPSCPDITGRVLESLGHNGLTIEHANIQKAVDFIHSQQDACGAWWGRWGVNYIYGTWQVLAGIKSVGQDMRSGFVQRAAQWLRSVQKFDGSWGETCASYDDPTLKGTGNSTASQTAWGIMGLMAAAGPHDPAVQRGVDWLITHQANDGAWDESEFTGTGFPKVFYLKYHLYRHYFPLMALGRYRRLAKSE